MHPWICGLKPVGGWKHLDWGGCRGSYCGKDKTIQSPSSSISWGEHEEKLEVDSWGYSGAAVNEPIFAVPWGIIHFFEVWTETVFCPDSSILPLLLNSFIIRDFCEDYWWLTCYYSCNFITSPWIYMCWICQIDPTRTLSTTLSRSGYSRCVALLILGETFLAHHHSDFFLYMAFIILLWFPSPLGVL